MKTKELIAALQQANPEGDLEVVLHTDCEITEVERSEGTPLYPRNPSVRISVDCYCGYIV